jgi:hypothetical protein
MAATIIIGDIEMKAKANYSRSQTGDTSSNMQGSINMSYNFWNGFLTKCFDTQNLESPMITTVPAWRPSLLYRLDCQGVCANNKHLLPATAGQSTPQ